MLKKYKKIGGKLYSLNGSIGVPKCTGCDLRGLGGRCMIPQGGLPECNQRGAFFLSHLGKRLV